jgi:phosphatidylserine/phosphatidylglycerophosphate/cardiolipin synthase-like enzyme
MHAKCFVVDERITLVGSANFTARGQSRNIEVGALIEDPAFAHSVLAQWQGLMTAGFCARVEF